MLSGPRGPPALLTNVIYTVGQTPRSKGSIIDSFAFIKQIDHIAIPASLVRKKNMNMRNPGYNMS